jgi:hypothetical protein
MLIEVIYRFIINTLIPIQFAYAKSRGADVAEDLIQLLNEVAPEKNAIIDKFKSFGVQPVSAFETRCCNLRMSTV